jgi:diketogulonate reductase-like aldo/keto reductase
LFAVFFIYGPIAMQIYKANQPAVRVIDYHNTLGQINYETFCRSQGCSPVDWSRMSQEQQAAWYQGAIAVVETVWREKHPGVANI